MKFNSLKNYIYQHLKAHAGEWVHKGVLGRLAILEWGYENENMGRRCRDLVKEGLIEVDYQKGCAVYRWIPPVPKSAPEKEKEMFEHLKLALQ